MKNLFRFQCSRRSFPKASAKLGIIFELTKYFCNFFMLKSIKIFITADYQAVSAAFFWSCKAGGEQELEAGAKRLRAEGNRAAVGS